MSLSAAALALTALALATTAPRPSRAQKKRTVEALVVAAVPRGPGEPAFPLLCVRGGAATAAEGCQAGALPGVGFRTPEGQAHAMGRAALRPPCEGGRQRLPGVLLDPPPPTGPFIALQPAEAAVKLRAAAALPTRVPDPATLAVLAGVLEGTPVLDQALVVDVDGDGALDVLWAVHRAGAEPRARLVMAPLEEPLAFRTLSTPPGATRVRVLYVSDLDSDGTLELYVLAELAQGWSLLALEGTRGPALGELRCEPDLKSAAPPPPAP